MTTPSPAARALATALREAREASGQTLRAFARQNGLRPSDLSQWENGHRIPPLETVLLILGALHVTGDERDLITEYARVASHPSWLTVGVNGIPQQKAGVVECERAATEIIEWISHGIPGLLQTPEYVREMHRSDRRSTDDIELSAMVNAGRREIVTKRNPVKFTVFMDAAVFYDHAVSDRDLMLDQYQFLYQEAQRPNVNVHIVPRGQGWHPGWTGPFVMYRFNNASPIVYIEHYSTGAFFQDDYNVELYHGAVERLSQLAKDTTETLDIIGSVVDGIEKQGGTRDENENEELAKIPCQSSKR